MLTFKLLANCFGCATLVEVAKYHPPKSIGVLKIEFCINMQCNYLKITHLPQNMQTLCIILHKYAKNM